MTAALIGIIWISYQAGMISLEFNLTSKEQKLLVENQNTIRPFVEDIKLLVETDGDNWHETNHGGWHNWVYLGKDNFSIVLLANSINQEIIKSMQPRLELNAAERELLTKAFEELKTNSISHYTTSLLSQSVLDI